MGITFEQTNIRDEAPAVKMYDDDDECECAAGIFFYTLSFS